MCLTGEDELYRVFLIVYNLGQTVKVGEEKMCALVSGEATRETDDQGVGVDFVHDAEHLCGVALVLEPFLLEILLHEVDEFILHRHSEVPDLLIGHIEDALPHLGIALVEEKLGIEVACIEFLPFGSGPCGHVHAVGDVSYVRLLGSISFPYSCKHLLRHLAMEPAYAVGLLACVEREHAHGEAFVGVGVLAAHVHQVAP